MDRSPSSTVSHVLPLRLLTTDGPALILDAELRYRATDPLAVEALFDAGGSAPVRWVFSRDLLVNGLDHRTGDGDVVVWPTTDRHGQPAVHVRLSSPDGAALLEAPAGVLREFLADTFLLVPLGSEVDHLDIDAVVDHLLQRP
jgi:hypothetical protein